MKVALVLCPQWDKGHPIYSAALLSALLKKRGHEALVFNLNQELHVLERGKGAAGLGWQPGLSSPWIDEDFIESTVVPAHRAYFESAVERILAANVRVAAFSIYFSNAAMSLWAARELKRRDPGITIVFGGPSCLSFERCREFAGRDCVDAVVFGEADLSFPALIDEIGRSGEPAPAPGVLLRDAPSTWRDEQTPIQRLDDLPFADYSGIDLSLYSEPVKTIHSCRGCVRRCVFCADWREMTYRQMSGERIYAEIAHQLGQDREVTKFLFGDSLVNASMKSVTDFCRRVAADGVKIRWSGFAIARPQMTAETAGTMRRGGCESLLFGVESGSRRILEAIAKGVTPAMNAAVLRDFSAAGIKTTATWLVGYPGEDEAAFRESLDFVRRNAASISILALGLFWLEPRPELSARHRFEDSHPLYWSTDDGNTFPERLARAERLMTAAAERGVTAVLQGRYGLADFRRERDEMLTEYERWKAARSLLKK